MNVEPRPLSFLESMQQEATKHLLSSIIYCWAEGTGPVELDHVRTALGILHERHPLLRSRILTWSPFMRFLRTRSCLIW